MSRVDLNVTKLQYLRGSVNNRIVRIALNKASAPAKEAVVAAAPAGNGHLKKSIRIKAVYYASSQTWVAVVGVSRAYKRVKPKAKKRKGKKVPKARKRYRRKNLAQRKLARLMKTVRPLKSRVRRSLKKAFAKVKKRYFTTTRYIRPAKYALARENRRAYIRPVATRVGGQFRRILADKIKEEIGKALSG